MNIKFFKLSAILTFTIRYFDMVLQERLQENLTTLPKSAGKVVDHVNFCWRDQIWNTCASKLELSAFSFRFICPYSVNINWKRQENSLAIQCVSQFIEIVIHAGKTRNNVKNVVYRKVQNRNIESRVSSPPGVCLMLWWRHQHPPPPNCKSLPPNVLKISQILDEQN